MEIMGLSAYQKRIADLLWDLETQEQVDYVLQRMGRDAEVVYQMMIAAYQDGNMDTDMAYDVLERYM
jgi:hypothetical protein